MLKSKKLLVVFLLIFLLVFSFALTSCEEGELKIDKATGAIEVGATITVNATLGETAVGGDALTITMDKQGIVTVTAGESGYVIKGVAKGTVVVTFTKGEKTVTATITVNDTAGDAAAALAAAKSSKLAEFDALLATYKQADYSAANWTTLTGYITAAKATVNGATTAAAVTAIATAPVKAQCDAVKTLAQEQAEADAAAAAAALAEAKVAKNAQIDALIANYLQPNYSVEGWAAIQGILADGKAAVDALETKEAVEAYSTAALTTAAGKVPTAAQEKALADAKKIHIAALTALQTEFDAKMEQYSDENWAAIQAIIVNAKAQVNAYTNLVDLQTYRLAAVRADVEAIPTITETATFEAEKTMILANLEVYIEDSYEQDKYSAANWAKLLGIVAEAKAKAEAATKSADLPDMIVLGNKCAEILTIESEEALDAAITAKYEEITNLLKGYVRDNYSDAGWTKFNQIVVNEKARIAKLPNAGEVALVDIAAGLKVALDAVLTSEQEVLLNAAKTAAKLVVDDILREIEFKLSNYTPAGRIKLSEAAVTVKLNIDKCETTAAVAAFDAAAIRTALRKVDTAAVEAFKAAKAAKIAELNALLATYKQANYTTANWSKVGVRWVASESAEIGYALGELKPGEFDGVKTIVNLAIAKATAATTQEGLDAVVVADVKDDCDDVDTIAEQLQTAKTTRITALKALIGVAAPAVYLEGNYFEDEWAIIEDIIAKKEADIKAYTRIELVNNFDTADFVATKALLTAVPQKAAALTAKKAAKTAALNAILAGYKATDYSINWNWTKVADANPYNGINTIITNALAVVTAASLEAGSEATITAFNGLSISEIKAQCALIKTDLRLAKDRVLKILEDGTEGITDAYVLAGYTNKGYKDYVKTQYLPTNWTKLENIFTNAKAAVEALTKVTDVDDYATKSLGKAADGKTNLPSALYTALTAAYDIFDINVTTRKTSIKTSIDTAKTGLALVEANYSTTALTRIATIVLNAKSKVDAFTKTTELDNFATADVMDDIKAVLPKLDWTTGTEPDVLNWKGEDSLIATKGTITTALTALQGTYKEADYYANQWKALKKIIDDAKKAVTASYTWEELRAALALPKHEVGDPHANLYVVNEDAIKAACDKILVKTGYDALVEAIADKIADLDLLFGDYLEIDYSAANWKLLKGFVDEAREEINKLEEIEEVLVYNLAAVFARCDAVQDIYQEVLAARNVKLAELAVIYAKYTPANYTEAGRAMLVAINNAAVNAVNNLDNAAAVLTYDLAIVTAQFDGVMTELELAKEDAYAALDALFATYDEADYSATNWTGLKGKITAAKTAVKALTTVLEAQTYLITGVAAVKAECDGISTLD